jgi:hypothetical protein
MSYKIDEALQKILRAGIPTNVPVTKSQFMPSYDLKETPKGFVFWDLQDIIPLQSSEGLGRPDGKETVSFMLDVACVAHQNTDRKALHDYILNVLQPVSSGRRVQLTAYNVAGTGVFINFVRLISTIENTSLKTGQSTPDMTMIVLSFSGKATC